MIYKADFHIHTCLSPCGDLDMSPKNIVAEAQRKGLDIIAIADHNSALNCLCAAEICQNKEITFYAGIEINTKEEFHVLYLDDDIEKVVSLGKKIYESLPDIKNTSDLFGEQMQVNSKEEIIHIPSKFLGSASTFGIKDIVSFTGHSGLIIPSHVDRNIYSLIGQLGIVPIDEEIDALEIHQGCKPKKPILPNIFPYVSNSDAHYISDIGKIHNEIESNSSCLSDIKEAILNRSIKITT